MVGEPINLEEFRKKKLEKEPEELDLEKLTYEQKLEVLRRISMRVDEDHRREDEEEQKE